MSIAFDTTDLNLDILERFQHAYILTLSFSQCLCTQGVEKSKGVDCSILLALRFLSFILKQTNFCLELLSKAFCLDRAFLSLSYLLSSNSSAVKLATFLFLHTFLRKFAFSVLE